MLLACKVEEIYLPPVDKLVFATDNGFSRQEIVYTESLIMQTLEFNLSPTTSCHWANFYMKEWDKYCGMNPLDVAILKDDFIPMFKTGQLDAYWRCRSVMQIMDLNVLDMDTMLFNDRKLVAAALYLELAMSFEIFNRQNIVFNQESVIQYT